LDDLVSYLSEELLDRERIPTAFVYGTSARGAVPDNNHAPIQISGKPIALTTILCVVVLKTFSPFCDFSEALRSLL